MSEATDLTELTYDKVKKCTKCLEFKAVSEFVKRSDAPDGLFYNCKQCTKKYRQDNKERISKIKREHYLKNKNEVINRVKKWRNSPRGRVKKAQQSKSWALRNPEKKKAHHKLNNAIRDGKITRPSTCEHCGGEGNIHAHHHDYRKPFDVEWLCSGCHTALHQGDLK